VRMVGKRGGITNQSLPRSYCEHPPTVKVIGQEDRIKLQVHLFVDVWPEVVDPALAALLAAPAAIMGGMELGVPIPGNPAPLPLAVKTNKPKEGEMSRKDGWLFICCR